MKKLFFLFLFLMSFIETSQIVMDIARLAVSGSSCYDVGKKFLDKDAKDDTMLAEATDFLKLSTALLTGCKALYLLLKFSEGPGPRVLNPQLHLAFFVCQFVTGFFGCHKVYEQWPKPGVEYRKVKKYLYGLGFLASAFSVLPSRW